MMRRRTATLLLFTAGLMANTSPALAGAGDPPEPAPTETSVPLADTLYQRAKELMAAGRYAEACEGFAESNRIDQATGGTLLNLAVCHEKLGRIATAAAEFEQARALARHYGRPDREQLAEQHAAILRARVSTLSLSVHEPSASEKLLLDDVVLAKVAWTNLPVDPGDHTVSASAPGRVPWSMIVHIGAERESRTVEVPALADAAAPFAPLPIAVTPATSLAPSDSVSHAPAQRIAGFTLGGAGLAAVAVGAAFGVGAIEENSTSEQNCPNNRCNATGASDSRYALTDANVANVCIVAGIVAVGVATVLVLTSGSKESSTRAARWTTTLEASFVRGGSLGLGGAW
jgi:hypothetical protein